MIYIRPGEIVPGWAAFPFVDVLTVIAAIVGAFSLALKPRRIFNLPHDKLVVVFWALITISMVTVWMFGMYLAWLDFMPPVFCYFLVRAGVRTPRQMRGVFYLLIVLNVFLAVNGIIQYHTGIGLGNVEMIANRIYGTGIFNDPNDLGMTFVMTIPLVLLVIGRPGSGILLRAAGFAMLLTILWAMFYTNSRGAVVGLGAALTTHAFLKYRRLNAVLMSVVLIAIVAIAAPSRAGQMDYQEESAQTRIQTWAEGVAMFRMSPIIGVGYGQFTEYNPQVAHNSFVHTFAELGFLGGMCFVGMFYWYFKGLKAGLQRNADDRGWRVALTASGVGVLACIWFLSRQYVVVLYVLLALGACSTTLEGDAGQQSQPNATMRDVLIIGSLTVLGIFVVYMSIRTMAVWSG
ncbi:MAG TPA: O-antigen ligase family protein [Vicinamibacterales bacterium]|nr:O-antigen ligase family protein [Vicinamibacterales bacterium]